MTEFTDLSTSDTEPSYLMRLDRENGDVFGSQSATHL